MTHIMINIGQNINQEQIILHKIRKWKIKKYWKKQKLYSIA